MPQCL